MSAVVIVRSANGEAIVGPMHRDVAARLADQIRRAEGRGAALVSWRDLVPASTSIREILLIASGA